MSERITKADLDRQILDLNSARWIHRHLKSDAPAYSLDWAYGGVRVVDDNGSRDVTVRGTKREIYNILRGMVYVARDQRFSESSRKALLDELSESKRISERL